MGAALFMLLASPVYAFTACMVKSSSPGPVFYRQERIGKNGLPFNIIKFRSMYLDAEKTGPALSSDHDPRVGDRNGIMKYPTSDPWCGLAKGGCLQKFQGGTISTGVIRKGLPHGVKPDGGRQLVLAHTASRSSTRGTVELWALNTSGTWKRDHRFTSARFGYNGLATASGKVAMLRRSCARCGSKSTCSTLTGTASPTGSPVAS